MIYRIVAIIFYLLFFNISAMHTPEQQERFHVDILLQKLVEDGNENSIIIFPIQAVNGCDQQSRRKGSEKILSDIALNGVRVCLSLIEAARGKAFLVVDNIVDNHEEHPSCSRGLLCKQVNTGIETRKINVESTSYHEASFIVYNIPHYKQYEDCFDWAYGEDLFDLLYHRKEPCLVLIDANIYNKIDVRDKIYRRMYGKKKVLQYNKQSQFLTEYKPCLLSAIPLPITIFWVALAFIGFHSVMST